MFPTDSQPPVEPNRDPNFVDARPAHQVIANPLPGYDYSRHPEADAIHSGLAMKQINSGQPAAGMKIGLQMPKQPRPANIGIANAYAAPATQGYSLPEKFKEYDPHQAAQFSIPKSWGQGELTMDGMTSYAYSTPEETQNRFAREDHIQAQGEHQAHGRMLADSHDLLSRLAAGSMPNQQFGYNQEENAAAMQAIQQHMGSLLANDAQVHTANAQRVHNFDPRSNPAYMQAMIANMNAEGEYHRAQAANADPMRKLDLIDAILSDPAKRDFVLAQGGVDHSVISALPQRPQPGVVGPENLLAHLSRNPAMNELLQNRGLPFDTKLARASQFTGFGDKSSLSRQLFDTWLKQEYAGHTDEWSQQLYSPPNPAQQIPVLGRAEGLLRAVANPVGQMIGIGVPGGTGTGPNWDDNYKKAQQRIGLIRQYNINPFQEGE
jgi:hypothetical protein